MGELTYYETSPDMRFYVCKYCFTHIALEQDTVSLIVKNPPAYTAVFKAGVNLRIDSPENHVVYDHNWVFGAVLCLKCNVSLGWKHLLVPPPEFLGDQIFRKGRLSLELFRLNFWDGFQMLDAATLAPL